jgi:hypothetical protein
VTTITSFSPPAPPPLMLPSGKAVSTVSQGELYSELDRLKIPGFSHRNGRPDNEAAYRQHLAGLAQEAGQKAVAEWLLQNRGG